MESSNIAVIQPDMFERNTESYEEGEELTDGSEREVLISLLSLWSPFLRTIYQRFALLGMFTLQELGTIVVIRTTFGGLI